MYRVKDVFFVLLISLAISFALVSSTSVTVIESDPVEKIEIELERPAEPKKYIPTSEVVAYLDSKDSPLSSHVETLLEQEHWKLLIAISAIESSYCKRQLGYNCWGITNPDGSYKSYASFDQAIIDANGLITRWQARGRWLTVEDMNCHYVVPCNQNWVSVVNTVLEKLESYEQGTGQVSKS